MEYGEHRYKENKVYNEPLLLSLLPFLHNVYSEWMLLYFCTAEAEQVVTKDSKNRSSAFSAAESGRFVFSALAFLSRSDFSTNSALIFLTSFFNLFLTSLAIHFSFDTAGLREETLRWHMNASSSYIWGCSYTL